MSTRVPASASEVQKFFDDLKEKLPLIAAAFNTLISKVKELKTEALDKLKEISASNEVKQVSEVKSSYQHLSETIDTVQTYLDKINGLYEKIKKQAPAAIEDIDNRKFKSTEQLVNDINQIAQDCKLQYTILLERCKEFITSCDKAETVCKGLQEGAESKQYTTKVAGGVTTAAVAAGGITASVLVGIFTFGVGFAVGLPVAIGATVATTTVAGVATAVLASQYGKAAESFRTLSCNFQKLQEDINMVQEEINGINLTINELAPIEICSLTTSECKALAKTMKNVLEESKRIYLNVTSGGLRTVTDFKTTFRRKVKESFL